MSYSLLSKNVKIKIYRTVILMVVLYGVKLGRSHSGRKVGRGFSKIGCRGGYLDLIGMR